MGLIDYPAVGIYNVMTVFGRSYLLARSLKKKLLSYLLCRAKIPQFKFEVYPTRHH